MYQIKNYSFNKAKKLGVNIYPSTKGDYKIDVYDKNNDYITSIGNKNYSDYPTYIETHGKKYANERKKLYHLRHEKDIDYIRGFLSLYILW